MRKLILSLGLVLVVLATSAFGAAQKTTCRITGKTIDQCCCEMKAGNFDCPFTKKSYHQCCCDMK
jgi:hypothetical protein